VEECASLTAAGREQTVEREQGQTERDRQAPRDLAAATAIALAGDDGALDQPQPGGNGSPARVEATGPARGRRSAASQGKVVELVRLIIVALFALGGWEVAQSLGGGRSSMLAAGIVVGSGLGYVLGGAFGRGTMTAVSQAERELARVPAAHVLGAGIGLMFGLVLSALVSIPLYHLPSAAAYPTIAFVFVTTGYTGSRLGLSKSEGMLALFGVKPRAAGTSQGEVTVLDSSVILDGRIVALVQMGFLTGPLLVAREVLDELQRVADSSDPALRQRGRRGLDLLLALKRDPSIEVVLVEEPSVPGEDVDARLVRLTRARGGVLLTNDAALSKLAAALDVRVRSIHALAEALRSHMVPGEQILLRLTRKGRDRGQGVGYTDDGTMVVVEDGEDSVGGTITVAVTNIIQTSTGVLAFARIAPARRA